MYDPKNKRLFLKRYRVDNVHFCDLYVGNTINVFSRQLKIVDYGDEHTLRRLHVDQQRTLGLIKPDAFCKLGHILDKIWKSGLKIVNMKSFRLNREEATELYRDLQSSGNFNELVTFMSSGPVLAFELLGEDAVSRWLKILGPTDPERAKRCEPNTVRALFGTNCLKNAGHGSATVEEGLREVNFFFPPEGSSLQNTACFTTDVTCCIIKPHIVLDGTAGEIMIRLLDCGFGISALALHNLERPNAEEFLEVYRGIVQEYASMVTELSSGPCVAMEIRATDAQKALREFAGPADPEIARHIRPESLRSMFGLTKTQNAVHCTDLPEDGILEVEYFFKVLDP